MLSDRVFSKAVLSVPSSGPLPRKFRMAVGYLGSAAGWAAAVLPVPPLRRAARRSRWQVTASSRARVSSLAPRPTSAIAIAGDEGSRSSGVAP